MIFPVPEYILVDYNTMGVCNKTGKLTHFYKEKMIFFVLCIHHMKTITFPSR